jgi:probable selenium-dependent hydroxylase accessory protein YqeC
MTKPSLKGIMKNSLSEALGLKAREMISLTGAGGKTTLMFRLARELSIEGKKVITTTTTKILKPSDQESPHLFMSENEGKIMEFVDRCLEQYRHITLAEEEAERGKLKGISPELAGNLWRLYDIDALIIEADGAAGRPIKAPREREPVIPSNTTLVVAVLGLDGVGKELDHQNVFQPSLVSKLTGIPENEKMTEEGMALLMTHAEGLFKGAPNSSRLVTFLNKADISDGLNKGRRIAHLIFEKSHSRIERVISGQLKSEPPIAEVFFP